MAASFNLTGGGTFPVGTSVGAYPRSNWPGGTVDTSAAPAGSATESKTVGSNGVAAFVALADGTSYVAYASVSSQHRYVSFSTPPAAAAGASETDPVASADLTTHAADNAAHNLTAALAAKLSNSLVDAKGDIVTATANDTPARLAVGSNEQVLTADSAAATGIKWASAASGYTDEQAQDAVGGILADTGTIDFTYTDATPEIVAAVKAASIDESHLASGASIPQAKVATLVADLAAKIAASIVDAKGDLIAGTAADTVARLAAGTDGYRLIADSTQTTGLRWQVQAGVENGQPGLIAPTARGWGVLNNGITAQRCFLTRFVPSRDLAVTKVGFIQGSAGGAGDAVDLGIYDSGLTTKLGSTGAVTLGNSTTGIKVGTLTATVNLTAGTVYYAAFVAATGATGSTANATFSAGGSGLNLAFGTAIGTFESGYKDVAANTLPSSIATPTTHETQGPIFAIRES